MTDKEFEQIKDITDSILIKELELTLKQVVSSYENRHHHKPTAMELIESYEKIIRPNPTDYISDVKDLKFRQLVILRKEEYEF